MSDDICKMSGNNGVLKIGWSDDICEMSDDICKMSGNNGVLKIPRGGESPAQVVIKTASLWLPAENLPG